LTRNHRRSIDAIQRRYVNRLVSQCSHRDIGLDESINMLTHRQLENSLIDKFGDVRTGLHLQFTRGEVIANSRGEGSLQQMQEE